MCPAWYRILMGLSLGMFLPGITMAADKVALQLKWFHQFPAEQA